MFQKASLTGAATDDLRDCLPVRGIEILNVVVGTTLILSIEDAHSGGSGKRNSLKPYLLIFFPVNIFTSGSVLVCSKGVALRERK